MILCEWDAAEGHPGQSCVHLYARILSTSFTSVSILSVCCYSIVSISMGTSLIYRLQYRLDGGRGERRGVPPLWLAVMADGHLVRGPHWFLVGSPHIAVGLRLVVFVSKVHRLYTDYSTDWMGGGERGEGCHPSDLLCWLTVIWSGAPTDSLGGALTP